MLLLSSSCGVVDTKYNKVMVKNPFLISFCQLWFQLLIFYYLFCQNMAQSTAFPLSYPASSLFSKSYIIAQQQPSSLFRRGQTSLFSLERHPSQVHHFTFSLSKTSTSIYIFIIGVIHVFYKNQSCSVCFTGCYSVGESITLFTHLFEWQSLKPGLKRTKKCKKYVKLFIV